MCNMTEEEFNRMLARGYATDEESENMRRDGEEAWEEGVIMLAPACEFPRTTERRL